MRATARNHAPGFKAKVAITAPKGDRTMVEQLDVHPNQISEWKQQFEESAAEMFEHQPAMQNAA